MDPLGARMKTYESNEMSRRFLPLLPVCARIDGKSFTNFTQGLDRPFDSRFGDLMCQTTSFLVAETQACIGYTQSDEISLIWFSNDPKSQIFFDGRVQKMVSVLASMTTAFFNSKKCELIPEKESTLAFFDCRVWQVPTLEEAANTILWREFDATKNSISMAARHYFPHKDLFKKVGTEMQEMLWKKGINWNDYPIRFKRGTYFQKRTIKRAFNKDELEQLPPKHHARLNPDLKVDRTEIQALDMPPFSKVTNRVGVIFKGESPNTESYQGRKSTDFTGVMDLAKKARVNGGLHAN